MTEMNFLSVFSGELTGAALFVCHVLYAAGTEETKVKDIPHHHLMKPLSYLVCPAVRQAITLKPHGHHLPPRDRNQRVAPLGRVWASFSQRRSFRDTKLLGV